jgi:hypothetical protein
VRRAASRRRLNELTDEHASLAKVFCTGTREINSLIVGRAITGMSAFV